MILLQIYIRISLTSFNIFMYSIDVKNVHGEEPSYIEVNPREQCVHEFMNRFPTPLHKFI